MAIVIDEAFMRNVMTRLQDIRDTIPSNVEGSEQSLDALSVSAGTQNFAPGHALKTQVATTGKAIDARLRKHSSILHNLYYGLSDLLAASDQVESLNEMSADDFLRYTGDLSGGTTATGSKP